MRFTTICEGLRCSPILIILMPSSDALQHQEKTGADLLIKLQHSHALGLHSAMSTELSYRGYALGAWGTWGIDVDIYPRGACPSGASGGLHKSEGSEINIAKMRLMKPVDMVLKHQVQTEA